MKSMPALPLPKVVRGRRTSPPTTAASFDGRLVFRLVANYGVAVGTLAAPTGDVVSDWTDGATRAEISERRLGSHARFVKYP
jgi:hypothetical protein